MAKGQKPDFRIRHQDDNGNWQNLGAAWKVKGDCVSVRVNVLPLNWDGQMLLVPTKDDEQS